MLTTTMLTTAKTERFIGKGIEVDHSLKIETHMNSADIILVEWLYYFITAQKQSFIVSNTIYHSTATEPIVWLFVNQKKQTLLYEFIGS